MKKFTLLLMSLLMVSSLVFAQKKLCVHKLDGTRIEVLASEVSYIDFEDVATDKEDDPVKPDDKEENDDPIKPGDDPVYDGTFVAKPFSVSATKTVTFSPGNLQYHPANNEWRFAPSQLDCIGEDNENISSTYNGWIDLFGWGTGNNPTNKSTDYEDYQTFVDWGVNKISNDAPNTWRTLTYDEWNYLRWERPNYDKLIGVAQVNDVNGLILLPDNWTCPSGVTFKSGFHNDYGTEYYADYQTFSSSDWAKLEASGAVFFPAAGYRNGSSVYYVQNYGGYWSATEGDPNADFLYFFSGGAYMNYSRSDGLSVRLVQDNNNQTDDDDTEDDSEKDPIKPDDSTESSVDANGYEYVDLGLSSGLLWATMNVGAESPEDYGDYFAWGETEPKEEYNLETYKWYEGESETQTKYCTDSYRGTVDNKTILELSDDVANVSWGGDWCMPTKEDQDELCTECTWTLEQKNGVNGYTVIGPNGNSIFLPAAGYRNNSGLNFAGSSGDYWSSSLSTLGSCYAYILYFGSGNVGSSYGTRDYGRSVRPVLRVGFAYDATFDSNGGEGTMPSITIAHAKQLSIPENKFTRPGYEFICWNTKADGTGVNYEEGGAFCVASDITLYAQWYKKEINITHEYVDLGLSVKWATCNVGATKPEETGYFFAWGETKPKAKYNWDTYKWCEGSDDTQTKYCTDSYYGIVDNKTILELSDDAANVNWGGDWRMPTKQEQDELRNECTWDWTTKNGVNGYTVTGPNGNSIFLPEASCRDHSDFYGAGYNGYYWSSSLDTIYSSNASYLSFDSYYVARSSFPSFRGQSVRPVLP